MPTIHLTTFIAAAPEVVFDLSRSVDIHKKSMENHKEEAVAGTRFGLMEKEDTVTWKAKHILKTRILRVKITGMTKAEKFTDEQVEGDFKLMRHEHFFKPCENGTIMIDLFHFESPYGVIGRFFNVLFFTRYMKKLLEHRNNLIKEIAETGKWRQLLAV
ncbi:MAG: SRPBCC family protein [Bacteroidetes bacterium]|nr:SRPBCC family protein [Bacteroidota bacterium]